MINDNSYISISLGKNDEKSFREYETDIITDLISKTKKSIFIISTESPLNGHEKPALAFRDLNPSIHKRFISGLRDKEKTNSFDIIYDKDNNIYGERFSKGIHAKIIVIDDEIVIMGSGNWFTNKPSDFDDSLVVFKCDNALSRYNPVYSKNSDYYKIIEKQLNMVDKLEDAFNFLRIMKSDALLNPNFFMVDPNLEKKIIDKIVALLPNHLKDYKVLYDFINESSGLVHDDVKEIVLNNLNKLLSNDEKKELDNAFEKYNKEADL